MGLLDIFRKLPVEQRVERLEKTFFESPEGQQIVAQAEQTMASRRAEAVARYTAATDKFAKEWPKLNKAFEAADAKYKQAHSQLKAAYEERKAAYASWQNAEHIANKAKADALIVLTREAPDERIDTFLSWVTTEIERLQSTGPTVRPGKMVQTFWNGPQMSGAVSNDAAMKARVAALQNILANAESLRIMPDPVELETRIASLRAALPSADVWPEPELSPPQPATGREVAAV